MYVVCIYIYVSLYTCTLCLLMSYKSMYVGVYACIGICDGSQCCPFVGHMYVHIYT